MDNIGQPYGNRLRSEGTSSVVITEPDSNASSSSNVPVLKLRLTKAKNDKKVQWSETTVDNEHLDKKKSKCCCIYKKTLAFDESSSEDDADCDNCRGHVEMKKK